MSPSKPWFSGAALALCVGLTACAGTQPVPYAGITSSDRLHQNTLDETGRIPLAYRSGVALRRYGSVSLDPVLIYRGADNQFEDIAESDKRELAAYMQRQFSDRLDGYARHASGAAGKALRIQVTLTGAKSSTAVLSTLSRFDLVGGPYNAVQAARGKEGAFTGSVTYAVEVFDADTQVLLAAYVSKQYPGAWDLKAGIGALNAAKAGIRSGADELVSYLQDN
ncbi:MAG TPA: DUF3313 domain-containing protein [Ideonella sp.]|uniref:DUF3313 domain-containing protein n=1 Tax=Ideonella sp. TaxID=1929293 RepID=UPI002CFA06BA|nr:DUF3313 domain-containing protein [Ideonella sp.]HSI51341.1 DUF3313 domain-containing protein [Ideonella sp.]